LYKCVLENGFSLLSKNGFMGLLHPDGVYDDPNGKKLRIEINELKGLSPPIIPNYPPIIEPCMSTRTRCVKDEIFVPPPLI
jgi:hypothetical protein